MRSRIISPPCKVGKYHAWKKGSFLYGETGICAKCGYDKFEDSYREVKK